MKKVKSMQKEANVSVLHFSLIFEKKFCYGNLGYALFCQEGIE